jgi:hypothetical protein
MLQILQPRSAVQLDHHFACQRRSTATLLAPRSANGRFRAIPRAGVEPEEPACPEREMLLRPTPLRLISPALLHWFFGDDVRQLVKGRGFVWFDDGSETGL